MNERHYICPGCKAVVAVPSRLRTITLDQVRQNHDKTCPGRNSRKENA